MFNTQKFYVMPKESINMFSTDLRIILIISLCKIKSLITDLILHREITIFITETECVY
jgi:hypothetical protein